MIKFKYILILLSFLINSCTGYKHHTITEKSKPIKKQEVINCNGTKILATKSGLRANKEKTKLYFPIILDNRENKVRNDIIFSSVGFFQGHGDNGIRMPFKPYFVRVNPEKLTNAELVFKLQKNPLPSFLKIGNVEKLNSVSISITYQCRNSKGILVEKRHRYF